MNQLLIVDDEALECQYLKGLTDWTNLGVGRVYTANSMEQAVSILKREAVSLVLCDIEMPRQSGMDLLEWIRAREYRCEVIFITCHASFKFAQRAIQLGSSDYLLKPVEEEEAVAAVRKALMRLQNTASRAGRSTLAERFVGDAAQGRLGQEVPARLRELGLETAADEPLAAFLFFVDWPGPKESILTAETKSYVVQNIVSDVVFGFQCNTLTVMIDKSCCLALAPLSLYRSGNGEPDPGLFKKMIDQCQEYAKLAAACVLAPPCLPHEIGKTISDLFSFKEHNLCVAGKLVRLGRTTGADPADITFDAAHWTTLLSEGDIRAAHDYFDRGMEPLKNSAFIPNGLLADLFSEMIQGLYQVLRQKNIAPHDFLPQERWKSLHSLSLNSLHSFLANIHMLLDHFDSTQTPSVGRRIKGYVLNNLGKNITREDVARHVCLSPEYLSKVFKKETGMTLSEYILQAKIDAAKARLASSRESISTIAANLGYNNFSLFTKQFRDQVGMTPSAYRRQENPAYR